MAIFYDIFENGEKPAAFARLLEIIHDYDDHFDTGILGIRVLFHVLSAYGYEDLAFSMITRPDYPSYGNWVARGASSLWEFFHPEGGEINSMNHHFFGDISSWFIQSIGGIVINPEDFDCNRLDIAPHFVTKLDHAEASHTAPAGKISVRWVRDGKDVVLTLEAPESMHGFIRAPKGWLLPTKVGFLPLKSGEYRFSPANA